MLIAGLFRVQDPRFVDARRTRRDCMASTLIFSALFSLMCLIASVLAHICFGGAATKR
jgi:hypothetical protein